MLSPRLTDCPECANIPNLLQEIDCKLAFYANALFNNVVFMLNQTVPAGIMIQLIAYKRILTYKNCNPDYISEVSINRIASKVKLLTLGCNIKPMYIPTPTTSTTSTTTTCTPPTTTTTTTACNYIPSYTIPIQVVIGYDSVSPPEHFISNNSLEDACLLYSKTYPIPLEGITIITYTYYLDLPNMILYDVRNCGYANDGYYIAEGNYLCENGVLTAIDLNTLCGFTTTTTTTVIPIYGYSITAGQDSSVLSCAETVMTGSVYGLVHPLTIGTILYTNINLTIPKVGNNLWYKDVNTNTTFSINDIGEILDITTCIDPTTTTTTINPCPNCISGLPILIGTQEWSNCNLDVTTYANGDPIPEVTDPTAWAALTTGAWCYYNNNSINGATYGKLYNWYAVNDVRGLVTGYHVPSDLEWTTLTDYLGGEAIAGSKMKEVGLCHWQAPNTDATNESGFTGLPAGYRGGDGSFNYITAIGTWWSSSENSTPNAWFRYIDNNINVTRGNSNKINGFSVRLIKD